MLDNISVFHSSIRIEGEKIIYFDPYKIDIEYHDADIIFITHSHFDHYSQEDIDKVIKEGTIIVVPQSMATDVEYDNVFTVDPENEYEIGDISFQTISAYNVNKKFHPKEKCWVGYVVNFEEKSYYVAGDTDITEEAKNVKCDIALIPCGGTYTMDYKEAAELANIISPKIAVPTHYGSVAGSPEEGKKFVKELSDEIQGVIIIK